MDFMKTLVLIVTLSGFLAITTAVRTPEARVWTICKPTTNPLLCYKTILPQVGPKFNMYKALDIEILETQKQVLKTTGTIAGLLFSPGFSKDVSEALAACKDQYGNIVESLAESVSMVAQRNVVEARFKFSAVLSYHASCNDEFADVVSPFAADAKAVFDLGGNCLDIMKAIEDRESRRRNGKGNTTKAI